MTLAPTNNVILAIQNDLTDPPHLAGRWLEELGFAVSILHAYKGESVPRQVPEGVVALMPLGGHMNVNDEDNYPFLGDEKALLRDAVSREIPIFAICLGAQLLAETLGGKVENLSIGEVGVYELKFNSDAAHDPVLKASGSYKSAQWHEDFVTKLPEEATLLASSEMCTNQIFRVGNNAYGFQSHPELDHSIIELWEADPDNAFLESGKESVKDEVLSAEEELARTWKPVIQRWGARILKSQ